MSDELAELKARHERLRLLYQVSNVIHSTLEPREALKLILGEAVRLMRASSGSVALFNPTTGFLEIDVDGARKRIGMQVMIFLVVFAGLLYFTKKKVWSRVPGHA